MTHKNWGKRLLAALAGGPGRGWAATHRHKKGGLYRVLMHATLEADRSDVVVYEDTEGAVWVRPTSEFYDGRFEELS